MSQQAGSNETFKREKFLVPSCVVFAEAKTGKDRKGWPTRFWTGDLKGQRNLPWARASGYLDSEEGKLWLGRMGKRSALSRQSLGSGARAPSPYLPEFFQGATIVPRNFYFIEAPAEEDLGKDELFVRTDPEQAGEGKAPWKDIHFSGNVERELLFCTALSKHLLPFCVEAEPPWLILPRNSIGIRSELSRRHFQQRCPTPSNSAVPTFWPPRRTRHRKTPSCEARQAGEAALSVAGVEARRMYR